MDDPRSGTGATSTTSRLALVLTLCATLAAGACGTETARTGAQPDRQSGAAQQPLAPDEDGAGESPSAEPNAFAPGILDRLGSDPLGTQQQEQGEPGTLQSDSAQSASAQPEATQPGQGAARPDAAARSGKERGLRFRPSVSGHITSLGFYRLKGDRRRHAARVWSASGTLMAKVVLPATETVGWQHVALPTPVAVSRNATYLASVSVPAGVPFAAKRRSARVPGYATVSGAVGPRGRFPAKALTQRRFRVRPVVTAAASTPSTPTASGGFPGAGNTGVPEGVALAPYAGPMTVTAAGTVIDAKQITGRLVVRAPNVVVTRSQVNGTVYIERSGSLTMSDSTVDGGTSQDSAVSQSNFTLRRVEIVGARASVGCDGSCEVEDSWLHGQYMPAGSDWHGDGFLSNGGSNMVLRHNTLACDSKPTGNGGACSAAVALYGDFAPIRDVTVEGNLFVSSPAGYCLYGGYDPGKPFGGQASNVRVTGNVFARGSSGKCAVYGAAAAVAGGGSNVFTGNTWDDGRPVRTP
ncbi:DUF4082 domain-containing protein [Nocardioides houyundeii]|uniref:DUF4082 domain-containing protein n=1 Tax=Nocardioides houyundeii TaxID=2045452 RepID=UPI000DF45A60|nr:DUF4082 domain-containing protein [Nocardioides houyundeii]